MLLKESMGSTNLNGLETYVWDVIVVGAGPAGASAAYQLAQYHERVLLVDKATFPRDKVCGCCFNGRSRRLLEELGLESMLSSLNPEPLQSFRWGSDGCSIDLPLSEGFSVSRKRFDMALVNEAKKRGVHFLSNVEARVGDSFDGYRMVELSLANARVSVRGKGIVVADGLLGSSILKRGDAPIVAKNSLIGVGATMNEAVAEIQSSTIYMAATEKGYVGIVKLEDGTIDIAGALKPSAVRQQHDIGVVADEVIKRAEFSFALDVKDIAWKGTPALTRRRESVSGERLVLIGDASGYVEPFTGEGISWALETGKQAASLLSRPLVRWNSEWQEDWQTYYRLSMWKQRKVCRFLSFVLRRPFLTKTSIRLLKAFPMMAKLFMTKIGFSK